LAQALRKALQGARQGAEAAAGRMRNR
jgi:hypothetical protein